MLKTPEMTFLRPSRFKYLLGEYNCPIDPLVRLLQLFFPCVYLQNLMPRHWLRPQAPHNSAVPVTIRDTYSQCSSPLVL